jgi:putative transposase
LALDRFQLLRPALEEGVPLAALARERHLPLRTAERWVQRYRQHGLAGLARKPHRDRGQRRMTEELCSLIEGLALRRPRPSIATITRRISMIAQSRGWPVPSYSTVYAIVRQLDPAMVTLAQEGSEVYRERFDLLYRREASRPNEIWQADHTPLDICVIDERGQPARPWLTVILDDYSRAVAAYRISLQAPSALHTALTLRDAIWRKSDPRWHICGIPDTFYTDHGSDFTSEHLEQVAADIKMGLVFSMVGRPRGRGRIERFFETVNQLCLSELPGYIAPGTRPPAPTLTLRELDARLSDFFLGAYHQRLHGETGARPQERWESGGFLPRLPDSLEQLDLLLLTVVKARRIQQDGIRFEGLRYLDLMLAAYVGETVTIRYDPRDLAEIRVYYQDRFLCRAICQELAGQTISLKDIVRAREQRRRQVRAGLSARAQIVETLLAEASPGEQAAPAPPTPTTPRLKQYHND